MRRWLHTCSTYKRRMFICPHVTFAIKYWKLGMCWAKSVLSLPVFNLFYGNHSHLRSRFCFCLCCSAYSTPRKLYQKPAIFKINATFLRFQFFSFFFLLLLVHLFIYFFFFSISIRIFSLFSHKYYIVRLYSCRCGFLKTSLLPVNNNE